MTTTVIASKSTTALLTATRKLQFCAGHRVMGHENKCAHLHGHNYTILIEAIRKDLHVDSIGRTIDFSVLKAAFDPWIQHQWDHGFLLHEGDMEAIEALNMFDTGMLIRNPDFKQKVYLLPYNPTAENIALYLMAISPDLLAPHKGGKDVSIKSITVWETPNCFATITREQNHD